MFKPKALCLNLSQKIGNKYKLIFIILLNIAIYIGLYFQIQKTFFHRVSFPKGAQKIFYTAPQPYPHKHHRVAVFASFSSKGKVADYIIYYLKNLKKVCDAIIFVTDNPLLPSEADKIKDLVFHIEAKRHGEYDFGSYERGLAYLRKEQLLASDDSLILCNDSCYGPIYPFEPIFEEMEKRENVDFWGLASNNEVTYHLQSYFLVFSPKVMTSFDLDSFLNKTAKEYNTRQIILKYEVQLTPYLQNLGYNAASYLPDIIETPTWSQVKINKTIFPYTIISQYHFPLIKKKVFFPDVEFEMHLQEDPRDVLKFLKKQNPELYKIIMAQNPI